MSKSRLLLIDFYDSFTYNLKHYFSSLVGEVEVVYYDRLDLNEIANYDLFVLSPGPGLPHEKEGVFEIIRCILNTKKPLLGVCLGFQALAQYFGNELKNQRTVKHGVAENLCVTAMDSVLFKNLKRSFKVGLYHSWEVVSTGKLNITAVSENNVNMAFEDVENKVFGIQFHPESILTEYGMEILQNFCSISIGGRN